MHAMGLTQAEEDDIVLYWSMAAGFWITKMPYMGDLDFYAMNDWSPRKRKRYNDFYRECVRRQLYLNGPELIHLSKNPMYSGRVESLIEASISDSTRPEYIGFLLRWMSSGPFR